ncbi:alpha/beta fold hydrolase [Paenibacillus sp. Y412MC10]|uniref:alpha/beta fold hydrolase n=1 Tax=Geobacillus sp. (strain Y412MC10) TaxID=481743 RepID=UPI0011A7286E|nr:alpha/beta hydrolase [Paenibacillus sp. Y412MC10]
MQLYETMVNNHGVHIHVTEVHRELRNEQSSLVIIPGLSESAEDYIDIMEKMVTLSPRHIVVITLRGRGQSDSPASGYTLEDHISDLDAAIRHLELEQFVLMGYSRGVAYQLGYAIRNPKRIEGLIIGDYPAIHTQLPAGWVDFFATLPPWRGKKLFDRMKPSALHALQKDSAKVEFWSDLSRFTCPVLIIRGVKPHPGLSLEAVEQYKLSLPKARIVEFEQHDHNIFEPDADEFVRTADSFLKEIKKKSINYHKKGVRTWTI